VVSGVIKPRRRRTGVIMTGSAESRLTMLHRALRRSRRYHGLRIIKRTGIFIFSLILNLHLSFEFYVAGRTVVHVHALHPQFSYVGAGLYIVNVFHDGLYKIRGLAAHDFMICYDALTRGFGFLSRLAFLILFLIGCCDPCWLHLHTLPMEGLDFLEYAWERSIVDGPHQRTSRAHPTLLRIPLITGGTP